MVGSATSLSSQYRAAEALIAKDRLSEAEALYRDLMEKEPVSPNGYIGLAGCLLMHKDFVGARHLYKSALDLDPKSTGALIGLGSTYSTELNYAKAAKTYELALGLDEGCPEVHWGLAIAYAGLDRSDEAGKHLDRFKKLAPDSRYIPGLEKLVRRPQGQPAAPLSEDPSQR
ncbi:MAG: tetratricopeptide repeat protein [Verrucomicrobiota bacterium]